MTTTIETQLTRANVLIETRRYNDAEDVLRQALATTPMHVKGHTLLAIVLYYQDRDKEALKEAQTAIGLDPTDPGTHYVAALALLALNRLYEAKKAIQASLRLEPERATYHSVLARIYLRQQRWREAQRVAEAGLQFDPEHVGCANVRARALVGLGERDEAGATLDAALARDPENAVTHANQGWRLLHSNDHEAAFKHFREALRIDPTLNWARQGILEAMKARNPIYRPLLRYFLWMSRLTEGEQIGVVAGLSGLRSAVRVIARQVPVLYVIAIPFALFYALFAFLTWTGRPLFALVLRLDRFGRLALPKEEIVASNWMGVCVLTMLISGFAAILTAVGSALRSWPLFSPAFGLLAMAGLLMMMPVAAIFRCKKGWSRGILIACNVLLTLGALLTFGFALTTTAWGIGIALVIGAVFMTAWSLYSWVANLIIVLTR